MVNFVDKVIWITGASSGIGRELSVQLDKLGSKIILSARNKSALEEIKSNLSNPDRHTILPLDLSKNYNYPELAKQIIEKYKRIDYVFNNGGVSQRATAADTSLDVDREIMEINYFGNISITKAVLPYMQKQKSGHFVITSSISGKFGFFLRSAYAASKHALHGFYESLLLEEEHNNIAVTIVCPGKINTPISKSALTGDGTVHGKMDHNQATGMEVEKCVEVILKAVSKNKKEVLIGNKEILAAKIKRLFPALFWKIIRKQKAT